MTRQRRDRGGCLTCKQRKKKCDLERPSCKNCNRLGIPCGGYRPRLLWEDDPAREGIRRRGPISSLRAYRSGNAGPHGRLACAPNVGEENPDLPGLFPHGDFRNPTATTSAQLKQWHLSRVSQVPVAVPYLPHVATTSSSLDRVLWDHYINRFARTYPTHSDTDNPFLSCLAPVAMEHEPVRWMLMAIAGLHARSRNLPSLDHEISRLRVQALRQCHEISSRTRRHGASKPNLEALSITNVGFSFQITNVQSHDLCLVTTAALLAVFGKLSGDVYGNIQPYLEFAQEFFCHEDAIQHDAGLTTTPLHRFLHSLVSYNQLLALVAGTRLTSRFCGSFGEAVLTNSSHKSRPNFAALLCRISDNVQHVSSFDIDCWDGKLDFLPSFSMKRETAEHDGGTNACLAQESPHVKMDGGNGPREDEKLIIGEIYRISSRIHFFKQLRDRDGLSDTTTTLAYPPFMANKQIKRYSKSAIDLFRSLSDDSQFNTAILLPLGIIAPELSSERDQMFVIEKLKMLERTQCFDVFRLFSQDLQHEWARAHASQSAHLPSTLSERPLRLLG